MSDRKTLRPPAGGLAPPQAVTLPDATELDLRPIARKVTDAHFARHPDELERYGEAGRAWCTHDNQHLLNWAALDLDGRADFDRQLRWLSNVLTARGYPLENVGDNLRTAAAVIESEAAGASAQALADRLRLGAESLAAWSDEDGTP